MKKIFSLLIVIVMMVAMLPAAQASEYMNVYAPDGRVEVIKTADFYAWHAVGWYSAPVMYVYALDGRTNLILESDFDAWHKVSWYSKPVMTVYAGNKSTVIAKEDFKNWNNVGWDAYVPLTLPNGNTISVLTNNVGNYVNTDPAIYYNPKVYRPLSEIQYSPYGTNITLEKAKEIAKSYVDKNVVYCEDGLASYMNQWYGGVSNYENQIPELEDYSDSAYLIALYVCDIVIGISVNKTTGYAFRCGEGALDGWSIGLVY